jgi:small subunit ribosomal protein S14
MKNLKYFDYKKRKLTSKFELKKNILNYISNSNELTDKYYLNSTLELSKLPKNSSVTRVVNRCVVSGRSHGICSKYKLSRISLRENIINGNLMGFVKSSW